MTMASIEYASRERVEQIEEDARGIAMDPDEMLYAPMQNLSEARTELRRRGEKL